MFLELGIILFIQHIKNHFHSHVFENHFRGSQSYKPFSSHFSYTSFFCFLILGNIFVCYKHYISCWWLRNSRVIQVSSRRIDTYTCFTNTQDPNLQMKCVYYSVMYIQTVTRTTRGYSWHLCVCYWAWISSFKFVSIYHSILTRTTRLERAVLSLLFTVVVGVQGQPAEPSWVAQLPEHQLIVVFHIRETSSTSVLAWEL